MRFYINACWARVFYYKRLLDKRFPINAILTGNFLTISPIHPRVGLGRVVRWRRNPEIKRQLKRSFLQFKRLSNRRFLENACGIRVYICKTSVEEAFYV